MAHNTLSSKDSNKQKVSEKSAVSKQLPSGLVNTISQTINDVGTIVAKPQTVLAEVFNNKKEKAQNKRDLEKEQLLRNIATGLAIGIGGSGILQAIKHFGWMYENTNRQDPKVVDDKNTLYIKVPGRERVLEKSARVPEETIAEAINTAGPIAAAVLGYVGTDKVLNYVRKKHLQNELEREQVLYMQELATRKKVQSNSFNKSAFITDTMGKGLGAWILVALGSGYLGYNLLDARFPSKPKASETGLTPVKVKVIRDEIEPKSASISLSNTALETFIKIACIYNPTASNDALNLIKYAANNSIESTKALLKESLDDGLNKAASVSNSVDGLTLSLTLENMVKDAFLKEILEHTAALEHFAATSNSFHKIAKTIDANTGKHLVALFEDFSALTKKAYYTQLLKPLHKEAASSALDFVFNDLLKSNPTQQQKPQELQERSTTTDDVTDPFEYNTDDPELVQFVNENKDAILSILNKK